MAIIQQKKNGVKYLFEVTYKNGKHKWKSLGRVDSQNNNEIIVSKKNRRKVLKNAPAELILKTIETKYVLRAKKKTQNLLLYLQVVLVKQEKKKIYYLKKNC